MNDLEKVDNPMNENEDTSKNNDESESIVELVEKYQKINLFIITKELYTKISSILSYIQKSDNPIEKKISIVNYLLLLIQNIDYNLNILLSIHSDNEPKLNLYEIIIDQYIYSDEKDYIQMLKNLITLIFRKLSMNKNVYRYILSHISKFLYDKGNNVKIDYNFNSQSYNRILDLILQFYQSIDDTGPFNYFYFNGNNSANITIKSSNNEFFLEKCKQAKQCVCSFYILLFAKLVDYNQLIPLEEITKEKITKLNIASIKFKDINEKISINIKYKDKDEINDKPDDINNLDIPAEHFNPKMINRILIRILTNTKIRVYINEEILDINIQPKGDMNSFSIENIELFSGSYAICSSIMIYKRLHDEGDIIEIPDFMIVTKEEQSKNKLPYAVKPHYLDGFYDESHLIPFIKYELSKINENNILDISLKRDGNECYAKFFQSKYRFLCQKGLK